jgi:fructokinase
MQQEHLMPRIRTRVQAMLNGYLDVPAITEQIDTYIVPPGLGSDAGVLGALALAEQMVE